MVLRLSAWVAGTISACGQWVLAGQSGWMLAWTGLCEAECMCCMHGGRLRMLRCLSCWPPPLAARVPRRRRTRTRQQMHLLLRQLPKHSHSISLEYAWISAVCCMQPRGQYSWPLRCKVLASAHSPQLSSSLTWESVRPIYELVLWQATAQKLVAAAGLASPQACLVLNTR